MLRRDGRTTLAARPQSGAFAGETFFVSPDPGFLSMAEVTLLSSDKLDGVIAFTDGVSGKWLHHRTLEPAPGVSQVLDRLASGAWSEARLREHLLQPFWKVGGDDDRGVAYLVRSAPPPDPIRAVGVVPNAEATNLQEENHG